MKKLILVLFLLFISSCTDENLKAIENYKCTSEQYEKVKEYLDNCRYGAPYCLALGVKALCDKREPSTENQNDGT